MSLDFILMDSINYKEDVQLAYNVCTYVEHVHIFVIIP